MEDKEYIKIYDAVKKRDVEVGVVIGDTFFHSVKSSKHKIDAMSKKKYDVYAIQDEAVAIILKREDIRWVIIIVDNDKRYKMPKETLRSCRSVPVAITKEHGPQTAISLNQMQEVTK